MVKNPLHGYECKFVQALYRLNDCGWTFKEIGKWVKKLEDKGVIKYEEIL